MRSEEAEDEDDEDNEDAEDEAQVAGAESVRLMKLARTCTNSPLPSSDPPLFPWPVASRPILPDPQFESSGSGRVESNSIVDRMKPRSNRSSNVLNADTLLPRERITFKIESYDYPSVLLRVLPTTKFSTIFKS